MNLTKLTGLSRIGASRAAILCIAFYNLLSLPVSAFNDTAPYWARDCIAKLKEIKLVSGYPDGSFRPNATVTRTEFAILMLNAFPDAPKIRPASTFKDVPANFWGAKAIAAATERGLFAGYPDNTFRPQQAIPRAQGLIVLANAQQLPIYVAFEPVLNRYFLDAGQIPLYARGAIASAAESEAIVNYPNVRQLRPNQNMTRGEVAAQLCNARGLQSLVSRQYVTSEVNLFRDQFIFGPEIRAFGASSEDLLMARGTNDKIGYISHSGIIVIPTRYDYAQPFTENQAAVAIWQNDRLLWGYIDLQGNWVIQPRYLAAFPFSEGLAAVGNEQKFGFIDRAGNAIAPIEYDQVLPFSEGLAAVSKNSQWGFIDKSGNVVIPLQYTSVSSFSDGLARFSSGDNVGFIDRTGSQVISPQFSAAWDFSEDLAPALDRATKRWGFIDKSGNWAISPQFSAAQPFSEGLAGVTFGEGWGFIDKTGKVAIPLQFYGPKFGGSDAPNLAIVRPFKNGLAFARNGNSIGWIDRQGRWQVEPLLFNDAEELSDGVARVHVGGRWIPRLDYPNNAPLVREAVLEGGGWGYFRVPSAK